MNTYLTEWAATPIRVVPRESKLSSLGDESFLIVVAHHNPVSQAFWRAIGCQDFMDRLWCEL